MKYHRLKTFPPYFQALWNKTKTFEVRRNDRDFQVDDTLELREYDPEVNEYSGRWVRATVVYMLTQIDVDGIEEGYCVLGLEFVARTREDVG